VAAPKHMAKKKSFRSGPRSLRSPSRSTKSLERLPEPHEYAKPPVAESRMLSASSEQPCCHFPSLLVGEGGSESRPLIVLMGKEPAKHCKEKCFTF
jgi:hypothetical protein